MKKHQPRETAVEWGKSLAWAVAVAVVIRVFFVGNFKIPSTSMVPTLRVGDRLLADIVSYRFREPRPGDVVIFKYPEEPTRDFVKRMVGLPGQKVLVGDGRVHIDGRVLDGPAFADRYYYSEGTVGVEKETEIPPGSYYVLGDNSINSRDSRYWGFVRRNLIRGRAVFIYWPPWRMGFIR